MRRLFLVFTAFTLVIFGGVVMTPTAAQATPPTCTSTPTTWADLQIAMMNTGTSASPNVVCLGANLVGPADQNLRLGHLQYVVLDLSGYSLAISGGTAGAGIDTNVDGHLTIQDSNPGSNTLTAAGGDTGAGIGGGNGGAGGTITINSGNIIATGAPSGTSGAGIGGGNGGNGGMITINGGNISVTGGGYAAGIGGGNGGAGGTITINSGNITSPGGFGAAGVGGGKGGAGGTITINGGTISATGVTGAGIGGGWLGDGGTITINSGTIIAASSAGGAGIGDGWLGNGRTITISGGTISATGGYSGAGIGGSDSGTITISGGTISATGGYSGAGIGGRDGKNGGTITISGGTISATGGDFGAGIGGGIGGEGGIIAIDGGNVSAMGGLSGAGIGGGSSGNGGSITVTAGSVVARGGADAAGIGGGYGGNGGNVTLSGGRIQAIRWGHSSAEIGSGALGSQGGSLTVVTMTSSPFTPIPNGSGTAGGIAPTTSSSTATYGAPARSVTKTEENGTVTFTFNYDVSFNSGSGSSVIQQEVGYGSRPDRPTDPTLAGYAMDTWHTGSASGPTYDFSTGSNITAATTLYASWNAINAAPLSINAATRAVNITQTDRQVGSSWNVKVHSTPVTLGSGATDGSAAVIFSGTIPAVAAGVHRVEVSSTASNSVTEIQKLWFVSDQSDTIIGVYTTEAEANAAWDALQPSVARLSNTGLATARVFTTLTAGALLLLVGIAIVIWRRRRTY